MCSLRGDSEAWSTVDGTKSTFVCPPGAQFVGPITIWGYAKGGCGAPEPPEGAFLRVVRLDDSDTWSMTATATIPFAHTNADGTGHAELVVHAPGHVAVSLDGRPGSSLRPGDDEIYRIDTLYLDPAHPETTLQVHAIAYGTGPAPTGTIQIEAR